MNPESASELTRQAVLLALLLAAPMLVAAVVVGLTVSLLQALTQVQDQTLSNIPKIVVMMLVGLLALPWMVSQLVEYTGTLYRNIPQMM